MNTSFSSLVSSAVRTPRARSPDIESQLVPAVAEAGPHTASLPFVGAPLRVGWGNNRGRIGASSGAGGGRRDDKLALWSAVALQHHFSLGGVCTSNHISTSRDRASPLSSSHAATDGTDQSLLPAPVLPPAQRGGRLTLAQKMGLVPKPPPPPTDDEWRRTEARAVLREQQQQDHRHYRGALVSTSGSWNDSGGGGGSVCSICLEHFHSTMDQGQVILSCSHVFHERCFKQFERFMRAQERLESGNSRVVGTISSTRLACPQCRLTHYYKRTFFAGTALAQRAAIIRIQSAMRGHLARKRYTRMRLQASSEFRGSYVQARLVKLSNVWSAYLERRETERELVLAGLEARHQAAAAAYLSEAEWQGIIARRVLLDSGKSAPVEAPPRGSPTSSMAGNITSSFSPIYGTAPLPITEEHNKSAVSHTSDQRFGGEDAEGSNHQPPRHECPICLEEIIRNPAVVSASPASHEACAREGATGEGAVAEMRLAYEKKRAERAKEQRLAEKKQAGKASGACKNARDCANPGLHKQRRRGGAPRSTIAPLTVDVSSAPSVLSVSSVDYSAPVLASSTPSRTPTCPPEAAAAAAAGIFELNCVLSVPPLSGTIAPGAPAPSVVSFKGTTNGTGSSRAGVILSCGHCYHDSCLCCFERHSEWRALGLECMVTLRCPLCRSGYAKHAF